MLLADPPVFPVLVAALPVVPVLPALPGVFPVSPPWSASGVVARTTVIVLLSAVCPPVSTIARTTPTTAAAASAPPAISGTRLRCGSTAGVAAVSAADADATGARVRRFKPHLGHHTASAGSAPQRGQMRGRS